ncbi:MAG TPA: hypothetical protein VGL60_02500 [Acidimicrobiales bacterium]
MKTTATAVGTTVESSGAERYRRLHDELQQARMEIVYAAWLDRWRLARRIARAETELSTMTAPDRLAPAS